MKTFSQSSRQIYRSTTNLQLIILTKSVTRLPDWNWNCRHRSATLKSHPRSKRQHYRRRSRGPRTRTCTRPRVKKKTITAIQHLQIPLINRRTALRGAARDFKKRPSRGNDNYSHMNRVNVERMPRDRSGNLSWSTHHRRIVTYSSMKGPKNVLQWVKMIRVIIRHQKPSYSKRAYQQEN